MSNMEKIISNTTNDIQGREELELLLKSAKDDINAQINERDKELDGEIIREIYFKRKDSNNRDNKILFLINESNYFYGDNIRIEYSLSKDNFMVNHGMNITKLNIVYDVIKDSMIGGLTKVDEPKVEETKSEEIVKILKSYDISEQGCDELYKAILSIKDDGVKAELIFKIAELASTINSSNKTT